MSWPIGLGSSFRGVLDLVGRRALLPEGGRNTPYGRAVDLAALDEIANLPDIDADIAAATLESVELAEGALPAFDVASFREGHMSPVFFGSALRNFSIEQLLDGLAAWAPGPLPRKATQRLVDPTEEQVTGFVFKVQANMDPNHRDRVAFVRLCSGKFRRGMKLFHVRDGKQMTIASPILFFAQARETADEAFAGDIIGVPNHGTLRVGDTLTEKEVLKFEGIPNFAPELLRRVVIEDAMKAKQLNRALEDLAEEGVVQVFTPLIGSRQVLGVVGELQFEVLASRVKGEYGVPVSFEQAPAELARWISSDKPEQLQKFVDQHRASMAKDRDGALVYLAESNWMLGHRIEKWPDIKFSAVRERG
jgi:peptide chain release factor 3